MAAMYCGINGQTSPNNPLLFKLGNNYNIQFTDIYMCTDNKTGHWPQVKEYVKMFTAPMKKYCDLMIGWSDICNICKTNTSVIYQHACLSNQ